MPFMPASADERLCVQRHARCGQYSANPNLSRTLLIQSLNVHPLGVDTPHK